MSITGTLLIQMAVFMALVAFTMKFVWPPLAKALDERAKTVAEGLAAADKARADLAAADQRVAQELSQSRAEVAALLADAERRAQTIIDEAKIRALEEGGKIVAAAHAEAQQQAAKARDALRDQLATLVVKGAEHVLRKEINPSVHAEMLNRLKAEL